MIQKIKLYGISMGAAAVILLSGAWKNLPEKEPEATEAIVLQDEVTQENQSAVKETQAREEAVKCWCDTQVRRYSEQEASYAAEEKQFEEKQREREEKERRRRERKRREEKRRQEERQVLGRSFQCPLERIVEAEAGDQDLEGRILVANVILNRVHSKHFPDTIKGVVFANRAGRYQFSPVSNGRYYRVTVSDKTKRAVKQALAGKDISKGALYFMCRSASDPKNVAWFDRDLTKVAQHGCHEFFK